MVYVHANVMQSSNDPDVNCRIAPKRPGCYTTERLAAIRPETYRRVVELLAEPREHVSYRAIARECRVNHRTIQAIERSETLSIATQKERLLNQSLRIAKRAADRIEDEIDNAPLNVANVTYGIAVDKAALLSGDPSLVIRHEQEHFHAHKHHFQAITAENWQ
jgi:hypothetical protein